MRIQTGIIKGRETGSNRDGGRDVLLLQVELTDPEDVQTIELMQGAGDQYNPPDGSKVLVISNGAAYKIAIAVDDLTALSIEIGERAIRAVLDGEVKSSVHCKVDGNLVLNEGTDFAIQFTAMKVAFDQLKADHNAHGHASFGTPPTALSTADMSGAKIDKVRIP